MKPSISFDSIPFLYFAVFASIQAARLSNAEGVFSDGTVYQVEVEVEVFWDGKPGGDVRVIGDLTTFPQHPVLLLGYTPDVVSDFIKRPDGTFVGE